VKDKIDLGGPRRIRDEKNHRDDESELSPHFSQLGLLNNRTAIPRRRTDGTM
jgi:hypothetical protein